MRGDPNAVVIPPDSDVLAGLSLWSVSLNEDYCADVPCEMSHPVSHMRYSSILDIWHVSSRLTSVSCSVLQISFRWSSREGGDINPREALPYLCGASYLRVSPKV